MVFKHIFDDRLKIQHTLLRSSVLTPIALSVAGFAMVIALSSLALASADSGFWAHYYTELFWLNIVIIVILGLLVLALLLRLLLRLKKAKFGAKLTLWFASALGLLGIIPCALMYMMSVIFLNQSFHSVFNVQVSQSLDAGLALSRSAIQLQLHDLLQNTKIAATTLNPKTKDTFEQLQVFKKQYIDYLNNINNHNDNNNDINHFQTMTMVEIVLFDNTGQILLSTDKKILTDIPEGDELKRLIEQGELTSILSKSNVSADISNNDTQESLYLRAVATVLDAETPLYLQFSQPLSPNIAQLAHTVAQGATHYEVIKLSQMGLQAIYKTTLTLIVLVVALAAIAIGFVLANAMTAPLLRLARATHAVASGDFTLLSEPQGRYQDDLLVLTQSFNKMLLDLGLARTELTQNHLYLQQVLSSLTTGVMVIDIEDCIRSINPSAIQILKGHSSVLNTLNTLNTINHLDNTKNNYINNHINNILLPEMLINTNAQEFMPVEIWNAVLEHRQQTHWQTHVDFTFNHHQLYTLLLRATPLNHHKGVGLLLVFDDITPILKAQKAQAWGEVAQRLAHEIKNPLTPIQLSAERLAMKLTPVLEQNALNKELDLLNRSTQTIIKQVAALKSMVDEFRRYARLPQAQLVPMNLNTFIEEHIVNLYKEQIIFELNPNALQYQIMADENQLRQILHNLISNAMDATQEKNNKDINDNKIKLITEYKAAHLSIIIIDKGIGFSTESLKRLFEPYHTTKNHGTGLGLALVQRMIQDHRAQIHIQNSIDINTQTILGAYVELVFEVIKTV